MYDLNFARKLCACIAIEDDPEKITDMWKLLVAIVQENDEEIGNGRSDCFQSECCFDMTQNTKGHQAILPAQPVAL